MEQLRRPHARWVARWGAVVILWIVGLALGACQAGIVPTPSQRPAATPPAAAVWAEPPSQAELEAIRFRTEMGLRADITHVRAVAADPSAGMEFGVPLLREEIAELLSRAADVDAIVEVVEAEAAQFPRDYCGLYLDNQNEGAVTSAWKSSLKLHERAIRSKLHPNANVAFLDCRYSEAEVNELCDQLNAADHDWMLEIPAIPTSWGCGNANFRVEMSISSVVPDAADRVLRHYAELYNLPPGILVVTSDGTGAALRPWGKILITVLRPNGKPAGPNSLGLNWEGDLPGLYCGIGDMGFGVNDDGTPTELPCQAGQWAIAVEEFGGPVIGRGIVEVEGGKTAELTIRLNAEPVPPE